MSDGPQIGDGALLHARGIGVSSSTGGGEEEKYKPNEDDIHKIVVDGINSVPGKMAKLAEAIPLIGGFLASIIPTNAGQVGVFAGLESQGIAGKTINPGKGGTQGGFLYNALAAPLMKNSGVTPQVAGIEPSSGGHHSDGMGQGFSDMVGGAGSMGHFEVSHMSLASLGNLTPSAGPSMGHSSEMGLA
jgi:hypothetical protein